MTSMRRSTRVRGDSGSCLSADPGGHPFQWDTPITQDTGRGTCGAVVPEHIKETTASTSRGRQIQGKPECSQKNSLEMRTIQRNLGHGREHRKHLPGQWA